MAQFDFSTWTTPEINARLEEVEGARNAILLRESRTTQVAVVEHQKATEELRALLAELKRRYLPEPPHD